MNDENGIGHVISLSKNKTFWDGERALYMLLADHPYFTEGVATIRRRLRIPRKGFTDGQKAYNWEHENKTNKAEVRIALDALIADFNIKDTYRSEAKFFAYDYILSPNIVAMRLPLPVEWNARDKKEVHERVGRHKIGARVIKTGANAERNKYQFKAHTLYLELTSRTSRRDIATVLKAASSLKKEALPFQMPKPQAKVRLAWLMKSKGATNQQTAIEIFRQFGTRLTPQQIPLYAERYAKGLRVLRPLPKKTAKKSAF